MRIVAADAGSLKQDIGGSRGGTGAAGCVVEVVMYPVAHGLDAAESSLHRAELLCRKSHQQVGLAVPTWVQVRQHFRRQIGVIALRQLAGGAELLVQIDGRAVLDRQLADARGNPVQPIAFGANLAFGVLSVRFDRELFLNDRLLLRLRGGNLKQKGRRPVNIEIEIASNEDSAHGLAFVGVAFLVEEFEN